MKSEKYIESCLVTETKEYNKVVERFSDAGYRNARMNHAALGLPSEGAELFEALEKKDLVNVMEECGDHTWYIGVAIDALGFDRSMIESREEVQDKKMSSIRKLEKFTDLFVSVLATVGFLQLAHAAMPKSPILMTTMAGGLLATIVTAAIVHSTRKLYARARIKRAAELVNQASSKFTDLFKKELQYGRTTDPQKYKDVLEQLITALSSCCQNAGYTLEDAKQRNSDKLEKKRFKNGYSDAKAINRDLEGERKILEGKTDASKE